MPKLSIVICTYNRPMLLAKCLEHTVVQEGCKPQDFEVIVIDNFPESNARPVVESVLQKTQIDVRYFVEPQAGLSLARNKGIVEARAELIGFIDDDAYPEPEWVVAAIAASDRAPSCSGFGGKLIGDWQAARPNWLHDELLGMVGESRYGPCERVFAANECPMGGNMVFRRQVFREVGPFSSDLGRLGDKYSGDEEVDLAHRIRQTGAELRYVPSMVVHHFVPASKLCKSYFLLRFGEDGRSLAIRHRTRLGSWGYLFQVFLRMGYLVTLSLLWIWAVLTNSPAERTRVACVMTRSLGYVWKSALQGTRPAQASA
jgi:glucosyl-dolichyl phosphate glucuronosyltransferase